MKTISDDWNITETKVTLRHAMAERRMRFLEDASARAVESVNKSRETAVVVVPSDSSGDQ